MAPNFYRALKKFLRKGWTEDFPMGYPWRMPKLSKQFYADGLQFQCQGSGKCCVSRGEYGFVYMTLQDRKNMAQILNMKTAAFTKKFCEKTDGVWHLKMNPSGDECLFLNSKKQCDVYEGRPIQCRTWPFWPENMNAKVWRGDIAKYCPGVGKGTKVSQQSIQQQLDEQVESEQELFNPELFEDTLVL